MKRDLCVTSPPISSFLSCEKDTELILRKLFVLSKPYSDILKSLLVIQAPDCLDNIDMYKKELDAYSVARLIEEGYIMLMPKKKQQEHEILKTYLSVSFDNFIPNEANPQFRDCIIHFDIVCHHDAWNLTNYQLRPFKILGYIDGLLNNSKLTGIGQLNFYGCKHNIISEDWGYHSLSYLAIHGSDDQTVAK